MNTGIEMNFKLVVIILFIIKVSVDSSVIDSLLKKQNVKPMPVSLTHIKEQIENKIDEMHKVILVSNKYKNPNFSRLCIWKNCPKPLTNHFSQNSYTNSKFKIETNILYQLIRQYKTMLKIENDKNNSYSQSDQIDDENLRKLIELYSSTNSVNMRNILRKYI